MFNHIRIVMANSKKYLLRIRIELTYNIFKVLKCLKARPGTEIISVSFKCLKISSNKINLTLFIVIRPKFNSYNMNFKFKLVKIFVIYLTVLLDDVNLRKDRHLIQS